MKRASAGHRFPFELFLTASPTHDKIRKGAHRYAKKACKPLIKNGRYFAAPQKSDENFKRLFARLAAAGVGRPVDKQGFADGSWTPETLADEISSIEANEKGIETRAVQVWFQDNYNGISDDNIHWLARVFGCGDPEATSQWQAELKASKERLAAERREKRYKGNGKATEAESVATVVYDVPLDEEGDEASSAVAAKGAYEQGEHRITGLNLALRCERMFSGPNTMLMPIVIWGGLGVLWFVAISLGVHSVTYSPSPGIDKQVGFIWSPGWNIGEPIFLPIYLILSTSLVTAWRDTERSRFIALGGVEHIDSWHKKVVRFTSSFWAIFLICFVLIFIVQWVGVYLMPLLAGSPDVPMIDWMLVALVRPEVLSTDGAIFASILGFFYSGIIYWFLFTGSLFLIIMSADFAAITDTKDAKHTPVFNGLVFQNGMKIMEVVFRCTILGIMVALSIKLNAAYLVSDAESISAWIWHDALLLIGYRTDGWAWINGSPSPFFTSFLLLFLLCFVFAVCLSQVKSAFDRANLFDQEERNSRRTWFRMCVVLGVVSTGYLLIGQFYGFSVILGLSIAVALTSLFWRVEPQSKKPRAKG